MLGNACYHSAQKLLSSRLLSKKLKIKIYRTKSLPVVLCGCESWSLTLREERRLRVFENGVLRRLFSLKRDEVPGEWRKLYNEELKGLYSSPNYVRMIKSRRMHGRGMWPVWGKVVKCIGCCWGNPRGRDLCGNPGVDGRITL